jgi:hypothetical protein
LPPAAKTLFEKRVLDSQKLFIGYGLDTLFFFVHLCVSSWLKLDGGFGQPKFTIKSGGEFDTDKKIIFNFFILQLFLR